jgi:DNA-binding transcriptional LysR family regulator
MAAQISLKQLQCFVAVAEELNFRRAAERLFMTQPPLSRQIKSLEEKLGLVLFERSRSGVHLTRFGDQFLLKARALLRQSEELASDVAGFAPRATTLLRVGVTTVLNPEIFATVGPRFEEHYPGCRVELKRQLSARCVRDVGRGALDVALVGLPSNIGGLPCRRLSDDPILVAMPAAHRLAQVPEVTLAELADDKLFWFDRKLNPAYYDRCQEVFERCAFAPVRVAEPQEHHILLSLIAAERGIALIPTSLTAIHRKDVIYKSLRESGQFDVGFGVIWGQQPPRGFVADFLRFLEHSAHTD